MADAIQSIRGQLRTLSTQEFFASSPDVGEGVPGLRIASQSEYGILAVYRSTDTYNFENGTGTAALVIDISGNVLLTDASLELTGTGHIALGNPPPIDVSDGTGIWIDDTGIFGLASSVVQASFEAATGKITAGGGVDILDANGISILAPTSANPSSPYKLRWVNPSNPTAVVGEIFVSADRGTSGGNDGYLDVTIRNVPSGLTEYGNFATTYNYGGALTLSASNLITGNVVGNVSLQLVAGAIGVTHHARLFASTGAFAGFTIGASTQPNATLDVRGSLYAGTSKFQVDANGNITKLNNITYSFPSAQGGSGNYLRNNGSGTLTWVDPNTLHAPLGAQYVVLSADGTLNNERVLTGTSNQITITDNGAGSTVVLSTPQNIHTAATPTFQGLTLSHTAPTLTMTDTTASAKSLLLTTDANKSIFSEVGGAANNLLSLDLANARVGIGIAAANEKLEVYGGNVRVGGVNSYLTIDGNNGTAGVINSPSWDLTLRTNGTDRIYITNAGYITVATSTSQRIGFWGATPIVRPTTTIGGVTFVANAGTAVNTASTFDGYTLGQVVFALRLMGLLT